MSAGLDGLRLGAAADAMREVSRIDNDVDQFTIRQVTILLAIYAAAGPPDVVQIAHKLGYERATVSRCVEKLAAYGLIKRQPKNGNILALLPTPDGILIVSKLATHLGFVT
jgi:DNA-binding MarR family transcriptional regulator